MTDKYEIVCGSLVVDIKKLPHFTIYIKDLEQFLDAGHTVTIKKVKADDV